MSTVRQGAERENDTAMPGWVKAFGIAALLFVVLIGMLHLTGVIPTGGHGSHGMTAHIGDAAMSHGATQP